MVWQSNFFGAMIDKIFKVKKYEPKRKYTLKPDRIDLRDIVYRSTSFKNHKQLPKAVDLRSKMPPVVDQGELGSCTANAIVSGLREYLQLKNNEQLVRLSRLYLYWHERQIEGTVNEDSGAYIRDGMKVLYRLGCAPEADFPYDITMFTIPPTSKAEMDAGQFKISSYQRITSLSMLKASIAEQLPVVIGLTVYESFESDQVAHTGMVPFPKGREQILGGHAMLAVGFDDVKQYVIVRNSWGEEWGDKGYCYLPYTFFTKGIVNDMWIGT